MNKNQKIMQEYYFNFKFQGRQFDCSYTITTSEISCRVAYAIKILGETPSYIDLATEGDSELIECYSSKELQPDLKEAIRQALENELT